jgi:hypothetical protein
LGGRRKLTDKEIDYVNFVANFTAISLKVMLSITSLKKNVFTLTMLNEFMQGVFLKNDENEIFNLLALTLIGHFKVSGVMIVKFDGRARIIFSYPQERSESRFMRKISKLKSEKKLNGFLVRKQIGQIRFIFRSR